MDMTDHTAGYKETSREAWSDPNNARYKVREMVLELLSEMPDGATDEELEKILGTEKTRTARPTRHALRNEGLVRNTGRKRVTDSGCSAIVWEITPEDEIEEQRQKTLPDVTRARIKAKMKTLDLEQLTRVEEMIESIKEITKNETVTSNQNDGRRVFLAHARHDTDEQIDEWTKRLAHLMSDGIGDVVVVPGRDDFKKRQPALGSWRAWCEDVCTGRTFDGNERYNVMVLPTTVDRFVVPNIKEGRTCVPNKLGRATGDMVKRFLEKNKAVYVWVSDLDDTNLQEGAGYVMKVTGITADSEALWDKIYYLSFD